MSDRRTTSIEDEEARVAFVKEAARMFKADERLATFGDLTPGSLLAIRWGMHDRSIMVVKLDAEDTPSVFRDAIGMGS